jgi:NAD+ synthase (glutamine-hydrolysing)
MANIKPIRDLRNTSSISDEAHKCDEPIFITKNGYQDLVVMSHEAYQKKQGKREFAKDDCLGYIRVKADSFELSLGDPENNRKQIEEAVLKAESQHAHLLVLPEMCLTGYSIGDLFLNQEMLDRCEEEINNLRLFSYTHEIVFAFGAPIRKGNSLYNCAVIIQNGRILGIVPKTNLPNYGEFYEMRYFAPYKGENTSVIIASEECLFGNKVIFQDERYKDFSFGVEICEDLWAPLSPSVRLALNGARVIINLSASDEVIGKDEYRADLVRMASAKLDAVYIYSSCGRGESTQDFVYGSQMIIAEDGRMLVNRKPFMTQDDAIADVDLDKISNSRRKNNVFTDEDDNYAKVYFAEHLSKPLTLMRKVSPNPFILEDEEKMEQRCRDVLRMQAEGLLTRMKSIHCHAAVVGLSGGLDSTLALLAVYTAFTLAKEDYSNIYAITLPSLGTTDLTHSNAYKLASELGCSFKDININEAVRIHFRDIGHSEEITNAAFENSQARERTQILMDFANDHNAIMVGTGDLSELCLGWTTYGGDHMSMYGLNAGIPKTLVKEVVRTYAKDHKEVQEVLTSILNTPITPELIPSDKGKIVQKTEDIVGPYELTDFFIYSFLRRNYTAEKIYYLASIAYKDKYDKKTIKHWLTVFLKRFFGAQFKRSCLPDGMKIGSVAVSPRGDLRLPSDIKNNLYISDLEKISD